MKRNYIGLACTGHDNAIAIINAEGELVFAEGSERYLQNKRAINSPPDDMNHIESLINEYCDPEAELVIAKTWSDESSVIFAKEVTLAKQRYKKYSEPEGPKQFLAVNADIYCYVMDLVANNIRNTGQHLKFRCDTSLQRQVSFTAFDHHLTHAASACYTSPFKEAVCVIVDGFGEGASNGIYHYVDGQFRTIGVNSMHGNIEKSIGVFYGTLCGLCGFDLWRGEEWKVMGLAPYGKLNPEIYHLMRQRIQVNGLNLVCPEQGDESLEKLLSYARTPEQTPLDVADLAFTGQQVFCELMTELLSNSSNLGLSDNLVLGGGCALNSAYSGKILKQTNFKKLHIFSAPGDDGNAVGAAYLAYRKDHPDSPVPSTKIQDSVAAKLPQHYFQTPYLGAEMSEETVTKIAQFSGLSIVEESMASISLKTAELLAEGYIVGWVQGRAEFGPRALGNRSILADPRFVEMKEKINARVKFREEFRPFAPSVLHEYGDQYFEGYQESPYMERTLCFRDEVKDQVAAVLHEDGTGRLQTVKEEWNPRYFQLIENFRKLTGVPILLNTSFNVMGKPIIHSVEDALAVFHTSGLDVLVIGNRMIRKNDSFSFKSESH